MLKAYKLRSEYEGSQISGSIITGTDAGTMDIQDALGQGNGEIITGDSMLQSLLEQLFGEHGLVFDVSLVSGENNELREPLPNPTAAPVINPLSLATAPPAQGSETPVSVPLAPGPEVGEGGAPIGQSTAELPAAQHGDQSEYAGFSESELHEVIEERGLTVSPETPHEELVRVLEDDDRQRQEGAPSNGS